MFENDKKLKKKRSSQYELNKDFTIEILNLNEEFVFNISNLDLQQLKLRIELYIGDKNGFYVTSLGKFFINDFKTDKWYYFK